jgi:hypothetical protein
MVIGCSLGPIDAPDVNVLRSITCARALRTALPCEMRRTTTARQYVQMEAAGRQ